MSILKDPLEVDLPKSRADAISIGSKRYFDSRPCRAGHISSRYTLNGYCVVCQRIANRNDRARVKLGGV